MNHLWSRHKVPNRMEVSVSFKSTDLGGRVPSTKASLFSDALKRVLHDSGLNFGLTWNDRGPGTMKATAGQLGMWCHGELVPDVYSISRSCAPEADLLLSAALQQTCGPIGSPQSKTTHSCGHSSPLHSLATFKRSHAAQQRSLLGKQRPAPVTWPNQGGLQLWTDSMLC